ncbi:MAG: FtsX-like permease family protein [Pseudomonadales bacterium]
MSETVAELAPVKPAFQGFLSVRIGWRNLWRNRRRTWLTAGSIAFAVLLVVFTMAFQLGQYGVMIDNATTLISGHIQVQSREFVADSRFEDTMAEASGLVTGIASIPGVIAVAPRVETFALASADERSFGAQVIGIDVDAEARTVRITKMLKSGHGITATEEALLGTVLARNLGVALGDEVIILGSGKEGGVAAMVVRVAGLLESGITDLDRVLLLAHLDVVQDAFGLHDEVHTLAVRVDDVANSERITGSIQAQLPAALIARDWPEVMPDLYQSIEIDRLSGQIMYGIIMGLVAFSVVNSFIMTVFERTREFGMLLAIGMKPRRIIAMLQWESLFQWLVGVGIGLLLASILVGWFAKEGIYLGEALEDYAQQFYMPSRLYPAFSTEALLTAPVIMLLATQFASLIPALRIHRLRPVEALRST